MGSESDMPVMEKAGDVLKEFSIGCQFRVLSAHRSPDEVIRFARTASNNGIKIIIAGAGGAAHLAGVIASHTTLPVIGVPIHTKSLGGMDSLLSTVQMPGGVPVAAMAIGEAGARNAGIFALEMLGISDETISARLRRYKKGLVRSVKEKDNKYRKRGI
ncbi:MAG: 5-(carboxyamino)imidazole ribonucleotide mutase [Candidatus Omnitrophica bacterium]|nr:5-(carboxyamino)imidazole ribonucleotide mutase [Candidatus Omnitrophota bacterium]